MSCIGWNAEFGLKVPKTFTYIYCTSDILLRGHAFLSLCQHFTVCDMGINENNIIDGKYMRSLVLIENHGQHYFCVPISNSKVEAVLVFRKHDSSIKGCLPVWSFKINGVGLNMNG